MPTGGDTAKEEAEHAASLLPLMDARARGRGHAGKRCRRRSLAAADLPGDALHP